MSDLREGLEKLAPCPFCGGKDQQIKTGMIDGEHPVSAVYCMTCGGSGAYAEIQDHAIESWNRRTLLAAGTEGPGLRAAFEDLLEAAKKAFDWFGEGAEEYHILKAAIINAEASLASRPVAAAPGEGVKT